MKVNHKPLRSKTTKGLGQKRITNFKSKKEIKNLLEEQKERRFRYYMDYVKDLQLLSIEFKKITLDKTVGSENYTIELNKYNKQKIDRTKDYQELIKPIDKKIKELQQDLNGSYHAK